MTDDEPSKWPKILIGCALVAALVGGIWLAKPAYRNWKMQRSLAQAAEFLQQADFKNAALCARQVLALSPMDLEASRVMAEITASLRSPELVSWRQRMVDIDPENPAHNIALADAAMMFGDTVRAEQSLTRVAATNRNSVEFHKTAGMLLAAQNKLDEAQIHFALALKLEPTNELVQINRAVILLQANDTNVVTEGMQTLEKFSADPTYHRMALQNLSQAYLRLNKPALAIQSAKQLVSATNAVFGDRMLLLSVLKETRSEEFGTYLASAEAAAESAGPEQVQSLASWLISTGQTAEASRWVSDLPKELQSAQRVSMVQADLHLARGEWAALQKLTESAQWEAADFLRQAMLARAFREQQQTMSAQSAWLEAVRAARGNPKMLSTLARMAASWKWSDEQQEILWTLVERYPGERWAAEELNSIFTSTADTRGLNRLCALLVNQNPDNLIAKNNLAVTSLLLGVQTSRANELAREVFTKYPSNAAAASTYAYSLFLQGRPDEAVKAFSAVKPEALEQPSVAIYYGVILGTNAPVEAVRYLDLAAQGELLPEEKALLQSARKGL